MKFNDVLEKMVTDTSLVEKISNQADQYENSRNAFGKQLSIRQRSLRVHVSILSIRQTS